MALVVVVGAITWVAVASNDGGGSANTVVPAEVRNGGPQVGDTAPDFTLQTFDGKSVSLADYRGKPVVLNFWASYCNPCRKEFPLFREQLSDHRGDFVVFGVDTKDIESDAKTFARQQKATWPIVFDDANAVAKAYGVGPVPQTFFIRPDGTIAVRYYAEIPESRFAGALAKITKPASS